MNYKVIPASNPDWFSPWIVEEYQNNIKKKDYTLKTIDIYTYECLDCKKRDCIHSKIVTNYIVNELDKWISKQTKLESITNK